MTIYLPELDANALKFPEPYEALKDPNGLLAMGGDLSPERLISAYGKGIFPWYAPGEPILWWSPSPRAVFFPDEYKPSKSLKKFYRKSNYKVSVNHATKDVIRLCSESRPLEETWIVSDMVKAYQKLSEMGFCHSVEVWEDGELIGGLYGIAVGSVFCGESMFSKKTNASKIAMWLFCQHFTRCGGELVDGQIINPHTASLGAQEIARSEYLKKLKELKEHRLTPGCFSRQWLSLSKENTQ
ncbi:leucyl/phenylalanyl-tRNA--protein transferase [Vibrio sp. JC009]|uniref:leucyl/phenylalanyl-tRNA--protein transferase n=1 Tax=Vibrio sp. JC009 TaxID=2912314 RepID=UPI0023B1BCF6|nr:leucyl/phenylalanyl-tRNA--protein transferase [Vibrio sp. JC009]WED20765.1 leucyl/phenylalanyl-tRNA--protein transferase [Vibrio sp. JC009]